MWFLADFQRFVAILEVQAHVVDEQQKASLFSVVQGISQLFDSRVHVTHRVATPFWCIIQSISLLFDLIHDSLTENKNNGDINCEFSSARHRESKWELPVIPLTVFWASRACATCERSVGGSGEVVFALPPYGRERACKSRTNYYGQRSFQIKSSSHLPCNFGRIALWWLSLLRLQLLFSIQFG